MQVGVKGDIYILPYCERIHFSLHPTPPPKNKMTFLNQVLQTILMVPKQALVLDGSKPLDRAHTATRTTDDTTKKFIAFKWQRKRSTCEDYVKTLERRRSFLRKQELSSHPMLLVEWVELVKELDTVIKHGFKSSASKSDDARTRRSRSDSFSNLCTHQKKMAANKEQHPTHRPRSYSVLGSMGGMMDAKKNVFLSKIARHLGMPSILGDAQGDMTDGGQGQAQVDDAVSQDSDGPAVDSDSGSESQTDLTSSLPPTSDPVIYVSAADQTTHTTTASTSPTPPTNATPCGADSTGSVVPAAVARAAPCMHGNAPGSCKYGTCAVGYSADTATTPPAHNTTATATTAAASFNEATTADRDSVSPRPRSGASTPNAHLVTTAATPMTPKPASTIAAACMHSNPIGECKYGTCASRNALLSLSTTITSTPVPSTGAIPAAAVTTRPTTAFLRTHQAAATTPQQQSNAATATAPGTPCMHGNTHSGCKYGACATAAVLASPTPVATGANHAATSRGRVMVPAQTPPHPTTTAATPMATPSIPPAPNKHTTAAPAEETCPHGGSPSTCKYGKCGSASQDTPLAAAANTKAACIHGGQPAVCKYGACAAAREAGTKVQKRLAPPQRVAKPAGPSTSAAPCIHGNSPDTCKYGECPTTREFERMVQEELAKLRESRGTDTLCAPPVADKDATVASTEVSTQSQRYAHLPMRPLLLSTTGRGGEVATAAACLETTDFVVPLASVSTPKRTVRVSSESAVGIAGDYTAPLTLTPSRAKSADMLASARNAQTPGRPLHEPEDKVDVGTAASAATTAALSHGDGDANRHVAPSSDGKRKVIKIIKRLPRRRLDF